MEQDTYYKLFYKASMEVEIEDMKKSMNVKVGGGS